VNIILYRKKKFYCVFCFRKIGQINEPEPNLEEFWMRGVQHDNNMDPIVEETTDQQTSTTIDAGKKINSFFF
jgi:hypothetical protein